MTKIPYIPLYQYPLLLLYIIYQISWRPKRRDESLLWPPLIGGDGEELRELDVTPEESDEELDPLKDSMPTWRQSIHHSRSEEEALEMQTLTSDLERLDHPVLLKSYARLESAPFLHFSKQQHGQGGGGGASEDKWHKWVNMQKDWMNNVEENPDDYFDDNL